MILRAFRLGVSGGGTIRGEVRIPWGAPPRRAVILVHGFQAFRSWAFFPWVARRIATAGYAVVTFDFSRNGVGADPSRFTELAAFAGNTLSRELDELSLVLDEVAAGDLVPRSPDRIAILGHGRGGSHGVLAAAVDERVRALVTWAAVARFDRWSEETRREWRQEGKVHVLNRRTGQHLPLDVGFLDDAEANRDRLDVLGAAGRVEVPWLMIHGRLDRTVAPSEARALARAAGSGARLVLMEGADHAFGAGHPFEGPTEALKRAVRLTLDALAEAMPDGG